MNNNGKNNDFNIDDVKAFIDKYDKSVDDGEPIASEEDVDIIQIREFVKNYEEKNKNEYTDKKSVDDQGGVFKPIKDFLVKAKETPDEWEEKLDQNRELVRTLLPDGNVRPLYESEVCLLCNSEPKRTRTCYAITDMGHAEPAGTKTSAIGLRVKTKVGSMIPVQIACCDQCKSKIRFASYFKLIFMTVAVAIALFVLSRASVVQSLTKIAQIAPLVIFIVLIPVAWLISTLILKAYINSNKSKVKFSIFDIDFVKKLSDRGWFVLYDNSEVTRLVFSKTKLKGDWFTN